MCREIGFLKFYNLVLYLDLQQGNKLEREQFLCIRVCATITLELLHPLICAHLCDSVLLEQLVSPLHEKFTGSLFKWTQWPELGQFESRIQKLLHVLPCECRCPSIWNGFHCFPQCIGKELHWKWHSKNLNQNPYGILPSQTVALATMLLKISF